MSLAEVQMATWAGEKSLLSPELAGPVWLCASSRIAPFSLVLPRNVVVDWAVN